MKTIVILTDQLHKIGGINSLIQLKANYWVNNNYLVHIITTEQGANPSFYKLDPKIGVHDLAIGYDRNQSYFGKKNLPKVIRNLRLLRKSLKKISPDLLIIANHIPVTYFFPLLKVNSKVLKEYHFTQFFRAQKKVSLFKRFENYVESKLDFQVVLNEEETIFYNSGKVYHIPNPIPFTQLGTPNNHQRKPIAIAAGRISPVKRFDVLLEIWAKFKELDNIWCLEIYGDGPKNDVEQLKNLIVKLGLGDSVQIIKPINNLPEVMGTRGMYLMTSEQECFPMVLLEAQASGLPIVSFDCPTGPRNIIKSGEDGILVEFNNQEAFVKAVSRLSSDESLREKLTLNGLESVQQYLLGNVMQQWEDKILSKI